MKKFLLLLLLLPALAIVQSCKKYPEGGSGYRIKSKLDGGANYEFEKDWKVTRYEVNNVDSTELFSHTSNVSEGKELTIKSVKRSSMQFELQTKMARYNMKVTKDRLYILFTPSDSWSGMPWNCSLAGTECERTIFMPKLGASCLWKIAKLTSDELVLISTDTDAYRIELTHYE